MWNTKFFIEILFVRLKKLKICNIIYAVENENKRSALPPLTLGCMQTTPQLLACETDIWGG